MLDTNVIISLALFSGDHFNRLKKALCKEKIVICSYVIDEVREVVERKFPSRELEMDEFFQTFPFSLAITPNDYNADDYPEMRDDDDLPILVSAVLEDVDVLISGDKDFAAVEVDRLKIITPTEFLRWYDK